MGDIVSKKTVKALLSKHASILETAGIERPEAEARFLLCYVMNESPAELYARLSDEVDDITAMRYKKLIMKRTTHYPLQYILGDTYFMDMRFLCREKVLIPRNDTEHLVECALKHAPEKSISVLDMCTGTGCIGISYYIWRLKDGFDDNVYLVDVSEDAISLAKENALLNRAKVTFVKSDLFTELKKEDGTPNKLFDMILSNPPYIKTNDINYLMKDVRDFEPRLALDGTRDGLAFYRSITAEAVNFLKKDGILIFEIGYDQYMDVSDIMTKAGFKNIRKLKDMSGLDRVVYGVKG